jgi:phosphoribosyl 1,2-cyclic phosphodiesterase
MIGFCPLASGSKGNSLFFGSANCRILIDAGLREKALKERLSSIGISLDTIDAIIITHEHSDHILGLEVLSKKYKIPVFANAETAKGIISALDHRPKFKIFATSEAFCFKDIEILPFSIPHDTPDPVGFCIRTGSIKLGVCADLGHVTSLVKKSLELCDYLYLEANHEVSMVHSCSRPIVYKNRVLSKQGHLSNDQCGHLLSTLTHNRLKHVYLAHLSSECNTNDTALSGVQKHLKDLSLSMSIAYQETISKVVSF